MKKLLLSILLLALALPPALAGEKTITISRNDVDWESANTVYNITKGGVQLVMSGGMNNPNFLLMKQHTTITVKSFNFNIKKIVFHCLDNFTNDNLDPFYWGPKTLHIQYSQTHSEYAGKLTYDYGGSSYDACWNSTFTGSYSTNGTAHKKYPDGIPANYELMFENEGKPVRFASIDIVVEQEVGDMYELVTSQSEIKVDSTYILVGRQYSTSTIGRALSVNETSETPSGNPTRTSTPVELLENGYRVKATGEVQLIKLEATGNSTRPYYLKMGSNYLRRRSGGTDGSGNNIGTNLYGVGSLSTYESDLANYFRTSITINGAATYYNALIRYGHLSSETAAPSGGVTRTFAIRHRNSSGYFRDLDYSSNNSDASYQRVYLYKPAKQYKVTTEVQPDAAYGSISLRDGVLVDNGTNWSQKMDTVQFLVTAADGYKISNIVIQAKDDNGTVVETISPLSENTSINGTLYTFVMPGYNTHIIATFEEVTYHDINIVVKPNTLCGNVFITEGYVVQQDQVKSYDGQEVVFNVTPNPINPAKESEGYYELSYVTITDNVTGVETTLTPDENGNYHFTMPDNQVTITAYFYDNTKAPLWLLGTDNGSAWHSYGPRFNYDDETDEYYIDVYYKGNGNYGDPDGYAYGEFSVTWRIDLNDNWDNINNHGWRGVPYDNDYEMTEQYDYGLTYDNSKQNNHFKIKAGIYRIKVGTQASQDKGYLQLNHLAVVKTPIALTFDPMGGETAETAVEVPQGQVVTLNGDLYNKIKAINPNEADANFYYKTVETIDGTTPETNTANGTATGTASLDVVNDGETVTKLEGWNYLGWIVADNSGYYKVISTPLAWIEEHGKVGQTYTVADKLLVVWTPENSNTPSFWVKDLPTTEHPEGLSIDKTAPANGQIDYMMSSNYTAREGGWDQSNWIELDCSGLSTGDKIPAITNYIPGGKLKGVYTDNKNYKMRVISIDEVTTGEGYVRNKYCTANFLENNLMLTENSTGPQSAVTGKYYYFLNPKVQEYATITYAMWDAENQEFIIPSTGNANGFSGALKLGGWDYNIATADAVLPALNQNAGTKQYEFRAIIHRENYNYGHNPNATGNNLMRAALSSPNITVWPIDLTDNASVVTAVSDVRAAAQVKHVEYVNIAGQRSATPWEGVNIVVTHYDNGSSKAVKVIK